MPTIQGFKMINGIMTKETIEKMKAAGTDFGFPFENMKEEKK